MTSACNAAGIATENSGGWFRKRLLATLIWRLHRFAAIQSSRVRTVVLWFKDYNPSAKGLKFSP